MKISNNDFQIRYETALNPSQLEAGHPYRGTSAGYRREPEAEKQEP